MNLNRCSTDLSWKLHNMSKLLIFSIRNEKRAKSWSNLQESDLLRLSFVTLYLFFVIPCLFQMTAWAQTLGTTPRPPPLQVTSPARLQPWKLLLPSGIDPTPLRSRFTRRRPWKMPRRPIIPQVRRRSIPNRGESYSLLLHTGHFLLKLTSLVQFLFLKKKEKKKERDSTSDRWVVLSKHFFRFHSIATRRLPW